jgi:hypothetical protein
MNCLLKHIIEGKIKERRGVAEIRGRRSCRMTKDTKREDIGN